jgi:hypothetical protein
MGKSIGLQTLYPEKEKGLHWKEKKLSYVKNHFSIDKKS